MENLYEFNCDCGRMGSLKGRFLATPEEVKAIIGKYVVFGEVLGKHSDISGEIEENEIKLITDNQEFLSMVKKLNIDLESGIDPISNYTCPECGCGMDVIKNECTGCYYTGK